MHTLAHCCLQGVCCAPGTEEQLTALATALDNDLKLSTAKDAAGTARNSRAVAEWINNSDMALVPKELAVAMNKIFVEAMALKRGNGKAG